MSWVKWKRDWQNKSKRSVGVNSDKFIQIFGQSGKNITVNSPEQAMCIDTVYRCVDILSGTIAALPMYLRRKNGLIYEVAEDSMINDIFSGVANERQTFFVLMQNAIISILLRGNAYILPFRNSSGEVVHLYLLNPDCVVYDVQKNIYKVYDIINNQFGTYEAWEIIHLKNKSLDGGYTGVSTITYASRTLSVSANADEQTLDGLKRGNKMKGFLSGGNPVLGLGEIQDSVQDKVAERLEREIEQDRSIMRLPGAITFTQLSMTPADAQLLETRKFSPYGICRFFGVHPDMVFVEQSSNYKASENSQVTFLNQTLTPLLAQIQTEFKAKLVLGSPAVKRRYKIAYDLFELHATDIKTKAEQTKILIESGVLTPNEARIRDNRVPVKGGDVTFISCNVAPIDSLKISGGTNKEIETTNNKKEDGQE